MNIPGLFSVAAILVAGALFTVHLSRRLSMPSFLLVLAMGVLVGRFAVGVMLLEFQGLQASDAYGYHLGAVDIAAYLLGEGTAPSLTPGKEGWVWILGTAYAISGPTALIGVALNAVAGAVTVILTAGVAKNIWPGTSADRVAGVMIALVPGYWFWGSIPLREASVAVVCSLIAYALTKKQPAWIPAIFGLVALMWLRGGAAVLVGAAVAVAMFLPTRGSAPGRRGAPIAVRLVVAGAALVFAQMAYTQLEHETSADRISAIRTAQGNAGSGFGSAGADQSPIVAGLVSLPRVLVGPFPWEVLSVPGLLPMAAFWWFVVGLLVLRWKRIKSAPGLWLLMLPTFALMWALAVYSGNYGTMIRLREQTFPFLVPLVAIALSKFGSGSESGQSSLRVTDAGKE